MKIYFIGIGGIGVSALAKYYLKLGCEVFGSDLVSSEITKDLEKLGAKICIGKHKAKNVPKDANLVIFSPAIERKNPEILAAKKYKINIQSFPEALGELTKKYFTIAVCGTHGKSTTTAMIGILLERAGFDPTVIVGTKVPEFENSNCRVGKSKYLVIEADEYKESFLNYFPKIVVLTTLEPDHLDYFKNFKNYILAFKKFVSKIPKNGALILNKDDPNIIKADFSKIAKNVYFFSQKEKDAKILKKILKVPGNFNVSNALASLKVAKILKIPKKIAILALSQYKGSWRRFEIKKGKIGKRSFTLVQDYAHHPTEVLKTLEAAREKFKKEKIICIFQPHQYQRTFYLFEEFVDALKKVPIDLLIVTDIYEVLGRESKKIKRMISSEKLVKAINKQNVIYLPLKKISEFLEKNLTGKEIVFFMGAGDIYSFSLRFQV